ncbi:hypothetical protein [Actinomadura rubrisoli]|nr:hypothetical protein [Actinomadura rubrisoli]
MSVDDRPSTSASPPVLILADEPERTAADDEWPSSALSTAVRE